MHLLNRMLLVTQLSWELISQLVAQPNVFVNGLSDLDIFTHNSFITYALGLYHRDKDGV